MASTELSLLPGADVEVWNYEKHYLRTSYSCIILKETKTKLRSQVRCFAGILGSQSITINGAGNINFINLEDHILELSPHYN